MTFLPMIFVTTLVMKTIEGSVKILPHSFTKTHTVYLEITILFNITGLRQSNNFSWKEILTIIDLNLIIIYFNQRSDITLTNSSEADTCIASRAPSVSRNTSVLPVFLHSDTLVNLICLNSLHDLCTSRTTLLWKQNRVRSKFALRIHPQHIS